MRDIELNTAIETQVNVIERLLTDKMTQYTKTENEWLKTRLNEEIQIIKNCIPLLKIMDAKIGSAYRLLDLVNEKDVKLNEVATYLAKNSRKMSKDDFDNFSKKWLDYKTENYSKQVDEFLNFEL